MRIKEFQKLIEKIYYEKDKKRGLEKDFIWLIEEIGELARAIKKNDKFSLMEEFADCLAWLTTLANILGIDLEKATEKYKNGCPRCKKIPCKCEEKI
jgi:NTP pyrophosphatase (non-canonical NTP hydrolase)